MENVAKIVALLRKQAQLESQILNRNGTAIASEQELDATRRRLACQPQALNAVLQTARALGRKRAATAAVQEVIVVTTPGRFAERDHGRSRRHVF